MAATHKNKVPFLCLFVLAAIPGCAEDQQGALEGDELYAQEAGSLEDKRVAVEAAPVSCWHLAAAITNYRKLKGVGQVTCNATLTDLAFRQARDAAIIENPHPPALWNRLLASGVPFSHAHEASNQGTKWNPTTQLAGLWGSPSHKALLADPIMQQVGGGIARRKSGSPYVWFNVILTGVK